jgi:uncharacterized RDD family membrane protein YckC
VFSALGVVESPVKRSSIPGLNMFSRYGQPKNKKMTVPKINLGTRIGSMILDHFAMTFIAMLFVLPGVISNFSAAFEVTHQIEDTDIFGGLKYFGLLGFALYFCKDSINGQSIAKKVLKLQVVEVSTGKAASPIKCFLRNLTCLIWPIEVIVTLFNPNRRIGDMIAGTIVVQHNAENERTQVAIGQILILVISSYLVLLLPLLYIDSLTSISEPNKITYIEESKNDKIAKETAILLEDSTGIFLTADVLVYDQVKEREGFKYVSVILKLEGDYLSYDEDFERLKSSTLPLLYSKFPEDSFVGQIKYYYKQPNKVQTRSISFR